MRERRVFCEVSGCNVMYVAKFAEVDNKFQLKPGRKMCSMGSCLASKPNYDRSGELENS